MLLLKETIKNHIARFHLEETFVMESIREQFSSPLTVVYNPGAISEQAIYEIEVGTKKYLQVNVKRKKWFGKDLIVSFYGVEAIPEGREIWKRKK